MTDAHDAYASDLVDELELRRVPADEIANIVKHMRANASLYGGDPAEVFGPPARYADRFAPRTWRPTLLIALAVLASVLGVGAGLMIVDGLYGLMNESSAAAADGLWGLAPGARLIVGGTLLIFVCVIVATLRTAESRRSHT